MAFCNYCKVGSDEHLKRCVCRKVFYCNEKCQAQDWKSHKPFCPPYSVREVPGKGRGLVATRKIKAGEIILEELPLLTTEDARWGLFLNKFKTTRYPTIEEDTKSLILKLHDPADNLKALRDTKQVEELIRKNPTMRLWKIPEESQDEEASKILRIFTGNCIKVCGDHTLYRHFHEVALYNNISLINHSCIPNSIWSWVKGDLKRKQVIALKSIERGEEILVNYSEEGPEINYGSKSREVRRRDLLEKRGFLCLCSECSLEGKALEDNERMRKEIGEKRVKIAALMGVLDFRRAMKVSLEILELVKKLDIRLQFLKELLTVFMSASTIKKLKLAEPDPEIFKNAALEYAIGDSGRHHYEKTVEEFEMLLNRLH